MLCWSTRYESQRARFNSQCHDPVEQSSILQWDQVSNYYLNKGCNSTGAESLDPCISVSYVVDSRVSAPLPIIKVLMLPAEPHTALPMLNKPMAPSITLLRPKIFGGMIAHNGDGAGTHLRQATTKRQQSG